MDINTSMILDEVCKSILEELAFLFCESQDAATFEYSRIHDAHEASMRFTGPTNGKLEIAAGRSLCLVIAGNMLGVEPDEDEEMVVAHADDALKEALNVLCGRFLTEAFGEEAVYNLTAPAIGTLEDLSQVDELAESECMLFFETDEHCFVVKLTLYKSVEV